jgi:acetyl-CoA acyltransferase
MSDIYVVGVGSTPFGRFPDCTVKDITQTATTLALADAKLRSEELEVAFFANTVQAALEGQYMISGEIALRAMGIEGIPVTNVENACASASTAFHLAYAHLKAGLADVALAVGAEKMSHPDKSRSFEVFNGAWDVHEAALAMERLQQVGDVLQPPPGRAAGADNRSIFVDMYAAMARLHMKTFGTTEMQLAACSAKNHHHSIFNPLAQYRKDFSIEQVYNAPMVSWPLTLPMCSPISDGAAAAILVREETMGRFDRARAVRVCASVLGCGTDRRADEFEKHITHRLARKAYTAAGISARDISVAEVHDASAFAEIQQSENLGFCEFGDGGKIAERGETRLGGRIPINTSGGLESKGHPIGATGLGQIYELVRQLRQEAGDRQVPRARYALAENGGGFSGFEEAVACITVLGR